MPNPDYKWDAALYQKSSQLQYNLGLMAIERLKPQDGDLILDIGCGNAALTIQLGKLIPHGKVTGIEVSTEMYDQARANLQKAGLTNVEILHKNALEIMFENEFNIVFSNSAIHWIPDLDSMYKLIFKALKTPGRIMIQTGLKEMNSLVGAIAKTVQGEEFRPYMVNFKMPWRFYSVKENEKILAKAGFQNVVVDPYDLRQPFETREDLLNYCRAAAFVPFLALFPKDLKLRFEQKFMEALLPLNGPNPLEMAMTRLFIQAEKHS